MELPLFFAFLMLSVFSTAVAQDDYPKCAPFQDIVWPGGHEQPPVVTLDGERYQAEYSDWSDAERRAAETFAASFEPEWQPSQEDFSAWHYFVVNKGDAEPYTAPVAVMMDAGSFSATDIFLSALATLPNVTLIGEASSGGSARVQEVTLPNTGLKIRFASMASFRPDGRLFDGRGVEPDIEVQPEPSFFLQGGDDVVLNRAVEVVSSTKR